jgi:hypothetical protein
MSSPVDARPQTELHAALPDRFIPGCDSTVTTRYGHHEKAVVATTPLFLPRFPLISAPVPA